MPFAIMIREGGQVMQPESQLPPDVDEFGERFLGNIFGDGKRLVPETVVAPRLPKPPSFEPEAEDVKRLTSER